MDTYQIKEGLLDYRIQEELSRKEMAEKLSMTEEAYAQYESEEPPIPDVDTLCRMSEVTNRSVDYLSMAKKQPRTKRLKSFQRIFRCYAKCPAVWTFKTQRVSRPFSNL